jgi:glycerol-3-phosphate dehydrogenase
MRTRSELLAQLRQLETVDVLVIGGGINGVGVYRDLAAQGQACLLVERGDFCSATSSAPSRLIHGGLRYLETGEFRLVRESVEERNLLLRNAPHLVKPLCTWVPLTSWSGGALSAGARFLRLLRTPGKKGGVVVKLGLMAYERFGKANQSMPAHRMLGRNAARREVPGLAPAICAVAEYYDARITHPERLTVELVGDAEHDCAASMAIPYLAVMGLADGGVQLRDTLSGELFLVRPGMVVNAAGASVDIVGGHLGIEGRLVGGTKGSHVVLNSPWLEQAIDGRMLYFETFDHRVCLVYRLEQDLFLLGTTDLRTESPDDVICSEAEIDYLFGVLAQVLPGVPLSREMIVFRFAGVRPLPFGNNDAANAAGAISRDHYLQEFPPTGQRPFPVLTLVGGKWTTYRSCAEMIADAVLLRRGKQRVADTRAVKIGGGLGWPGGDAPLATLAASLAQATGIAPARAAELAERYGGGALAVAREVAASDDRAIHGAAAYTVAEIAYLVRHERVTCLADLVLRRTLAAIGNRINPAMIEDCARIAAQVLGWDEPRRERELAQTWQLLRERHGVADVSDGSAGVAADRVAASETAAEPAERDAPAVPDRPEPTPGRVREEYR